MKKRETKIICTLGPASTSRNVLKKMAEQGMNVARLNFSHGTYIEHQERIAVIKQNNKQYGFGVQVLQDLEGYRIRIGELSKPLSLQSGQKVFLTKPADFRRGGIPFDFDGDFRLFSPGFDVFIDDGTLQLKVESVTGEALKLSVVQGGVLKSRKGVNIPRLKLKRLTMSAKDCRDLEFGIEHGVDMVAQSFVRNAPDITSVIEIVRPKLPGCKVIAKIENQEGVKNLEKILSAGQGIMIARGDLGVSLPIYQIPVLQKYMIRHCNHQKKISVVATQMLETMTENTRPTRAEVSDVANAVFDGADYVMLSAETAVGINPPNVVAMMDRILTYTENYVNRGI
ncbi:MAG: pyruvate kinase [Candidatus Omnitrophica bacterium]|nr:pyruvate kinase [Candidatus Omnitrophota bacterium]